MKQQLLAFALFLLETPNFLAAQTPTGSITGSVQTTDGKPVPNVEVFIGYRRSRMGEPPIPFNIITKTASDGAFTVPNVPDGKFAVCPSAGRPNLLPPCTWGAEPLVTVTNGQPANMTAIQLQPGSDLYVRVNDPNRSRAKAEGVTPGAGLMLAVRTPLGVTVPIPMSGIDGQGADHHIAVPADTDLVLLAFSASYSMTDANGVAINQQAGYSLPFKIPSGVQQLRESIAIN
jgi:hypothetical protein